MSLFLVVFMFALWTNVFSIGKIALQNCPPLFLTGTRMVFGGIILLIFLFLWKRQKFTITKKQLIPLLLLSFFSIYLTNILEFWGLQRLTAAKTCFIYSLSPFFAAFFSYLHFGERMNPRKWLGMSIGILGFVPVLYLQQDTSFSLMEWSLPSLAEFAIVGATLSSVYGWVLLRILVRDQTLPPSLANGLSMTIGGLFALFHSLLVDPWNPLPFDPSKGAIIAQSILWMTLISNVICYNLYGMMLKKFTATFLSFMGLLSPIFASLSGWALLGERPSPILLASTCIVVSGLWVVYQEELKQGYISK